jgi:vancomycin resistance protein YoaR
MDEPIADVDVPTAPVEPPSAGADGQTPPPPEVPAADAAAARAAEAPEAAEATEAAVAAEASPKRRRRWVLPAVLVPVVILVVLVIGWAVDTSSGGVARNVNLAGQDISRRSEAEVHTLVAKLASDFEDVPVEITSRPAEGSKGETSTYTTTASAVGLMVDQDKTVEQALDVGDDAFFLLRPFAWVGSFLSERDAPIAYRVSRDQVATATPKLEGEDRVPPSEPTVDLVDGTFQLVPGKPGTGLDPAEVGRALLAAAQERTAADAPIHVTLRRAEIDPLGDDDDAREAAQGIESLVAEPITITTPDGDRTIRPESLRRWVTLTTAPDGTVSVDFDPAKANADLQAAFKDIAGGPKDARFNVVDGKPVIVPEQPGKVCCGPDAATKIIAAIRAGTRTVSLTLGEGLPTRTAAELEKLGIVEEIGSPTEFGPTTQHKCCESRVQNIHRIADLIRGTVILPGKTFSVNDTVGQRTIAKGFTTGGAIIDGTLGTSIGGGISQFATTLFNASLFAGLDFGEYQSHSLYISRYPRGREATLSWRHPDLQIKNTTPYGVLIWPTYTDTSITVHLYSTKYATVSVGEPTASPAGACTKYTTPRTRTYPDGRVDRDSVFARYRPAEGVDC